MSFGPSIGLGTPIDSIVPGVLTVTGTTTLAGQLDLTGTQTDSSTGTVNDFVLNAGVTRLLFNNATSLSITGITGGVDGRVLIVENLAGTGQIAFPNQNAGSQAANRIVGNNGAQLALGATTGQNLILVYDGSTSRWRCASVVSNTIPNTIAITAQVYFTGKTSPTALSGTTNDYAPTGTLTAIRQDVSSAAVVTGLSVGQSDGFLLTITNIATAAANTLTFSHESASSTAANRFTLLGGTPLVMLPGATMSFRYDGTSSRWRPVAQIAASPIGSGSPDGVLTGTPGQEYTDSATLVKWQNQDGATAWDPIIIPGAAGFRLEDELVNAAVVTTLTAGGSNASSAESANPGLIIATVTAVSDAVAYASGGVGRVSLGGGVYRVRIKLRIATLSNATNNIIVRVGAGNIATGADHTNGVYYEYDFATNGDHKWRLCCAQGGTRTKTDTGILAVASSTTMTTFEITVNAGATSVTGKISGVTVATPVTTNIPTGAGQPLAGYLASAIKQLGPGALTYTIDRLEAMLVLTAAR